jgi:hypothetical protein
MGERLIRVSDRLEEEAAVKGRLNSQIDQKNRRQNVLPLASARGNSTAGQRTNALKSSLYVACVCRP